MITAIPWVRLQVLKYVFFFNSLYFIKWWMSLHLTTAVRAVKVTAHWTFFHSFKRINLESKKKFIFLTNITDALNWYVLAYVVIIVNEADLSCSSNYVPPLTYSKISNGNSPGFLGAEPFIVSVVIPVSAVYSQLSPGWLVLYPQPWSRAAAAPPPGSCP